MAVLKFSLPEKRLKIKKFLFVYLNDFHKPDCVLLFVKVFSFTSSYDDVHYSNMKEFIRSPKGLTKHVFIKKSNKST